MGRLPSGRDADPVGQPYHSRCHPADRPGPLCDGSGLSAGLHLVRGQAEQADRVRHHAHSLAGVLSGRGRRGAGSGRGRSATLVHVRPIRQGQAEAAAPGSKRSRQEVVLRAAGEVPESRRGLQPHLLRDRLEGPGACPAGHLRAGEQRSASDPTADAKQPVHGQGHAFSEGRGADRGVPAGHGKKPQNVVDAGSGVRQSVSAPFRF